MIPPLTGVRDRPCLALRRGVGVAVATMVWLVVPLPTSLAAQNAAPTLDPTPGTQGVPGPFADSLAKRLVSAATARPRMSRDDPMTSRVRVAIVVKRPVLWRDRTLYHREAVLAGGAPRDAPEVLELRRGSPTLGDAFVTRGGFLGFDPESADEALFGILRLDLPGVTPLDPGFEGPTWSLLGTDLADPLSTEGIARYRYRTVAPSWTDPDGRVLTEVRVEPLDGDPVEPVGSLWFDAGSGLPVRGVLKTRALREIEAGLAGSIARIPLLPRQARAGIDLLAVDYEAGDGGLRVRRVRIRGNLLWFHKALSTPFAADWQVVPSPADVPEPLRESWDYRVPDPDLVPFLREAARNGDRPAFEGFRSILKGTATSLRYNLVEGFSLAPDATIPTGPRSRIDSEVRVGSTSFAPTGEVIFSQDLMPAVWGIEAYSRLVDANRWSRVRTVGESLSTVLFGKDRGQYYRASGAAARMDFRTRPYTLEVQAFTEDHTAAPRTADFSVFDRSPDSTAYIVADEGTVYGVRTAVQLQFGDDPQRGLLVLRGWGELAGGDFSYWDLGAMAEALLPLPWRLSSVIRIGAGQIAEGAPVQKNYFLGGPRSVRGFSSATARGREFFLGRLELASDLPALRLVGFTDVGWAADSDLFDRTPLHSVGLGLSLMDSMLRVDLARAIRGGSSWKLHVSTNSLF